VCSDFCVGDQEVVDGKTSNKTLTLPKPLPPLRPLVQGDFVFCAATSKELPRYGIKHGLTNWSAAYATGLLCARRALTKLGLADKYEGVTEPDGTMSLTEACKWNPPAN
jgi:hypothetical protein